MTTPLSYSNSVGRLIRIGLAHRKAKLSNECVECSYTHPCPTYVWATTERELSASWVPASNSSLVENA